LTGTSIKEHYLPYESLILGFIRRNGRSFIVEARMPDFTVAVTRQQEEERNSHEKT